MKIQLVPAYLPGFDVRDERVSRGIALGFTRHREGEVAVTEVLATIEKSPRPSPWSSYWAWCRDEDAYVGLCAFKAPPGPLKAVEVAYYTFPLLEGRGIATQMAAHQISIARSHHLNNVTAHTLPAVNASGSVLRRLGFDYIGEEIDPEDGPVWAWRHTLTL